MHLGDDATEKKMWLASKLIASWRFAHQSSASQQRAFIAPATSPAAHTDIMSAELLITQQFQTYAHKTPIVSVIHAWADPLGLKKKKENTKNNTST